ncbi:type I 3-dehydroquinate dehydratase [Natronococcus roseus]|uniref:type I 3-dehydroquinate dehydratase n=1 Tax=Natronococcus roseus TaxID=1052014 RepID=UPI00374D420C
MEIDDFTLAATTNDLTREPDARGEADVIEFRMDSAENPIKQLSEYDGELPIIATNRSRWFGGEATDRGRLDQLMAASQFDAVEMVDIELEIARGTEWVLDEFRENGVDLIISFHEFDETPDKDTLLKIIEESDKYGDISKVAAYANNLSDTLTMLEVINTATERGIKVAGISMGETGSHTRVIAPSYGSKLGYAPLESDASEYAPGQLPLHELSSLIKSVEEGNEDVELMDGLEETFARMGFNQPS